MLYLKQEIKHSTDKKMAIPLRNTVFDKIKEAGSLTDVELIKSSNQKMDTFLQKIDSTNYF